MVHPMLGLETAASFLLSLSSLYSTHCRHTLTASCGQWCSPAPCSHYSSAASAECALQSAGAAVQGGERQPLSASLLCCWRLRWLGRWGCILHGEVRYNSQYNWQSENILFCSYKGLSDFVSPSFKHNSGFATHIRAVRCLGGLDRPRRQPQPFISCFPAAVGLLSPSTPPEIFIKVSLVTFSPV